MDIGVGSTHCLALTDDGEVHSWGSNDKLQHFDTLLSNKKQPKALPGLNSKHIVGVSCGPGQVRYAIVTTDVNMHIKLKDGFNTFVIRLFSELRLVLLLRVVCWAACALCGGCLPHDL